MLVMRPHKIWSLDKGVTSGVTQATYTAGWATDGILSKPFGANAVTGALTIAGTAGDVDLIVLANHNIWAPATVALSGDIVASFTIPAARPNRIQLNPFIKLGSPVSVDSLTVTVTNAAQNFRIGEVLAGLSEEWDLLTEDHRWEGHAFNIPHGGDELGDIQPYDMASESRRLEGGSWASLTQRVFMEDWLSATYGGTRPSVIIPYEADNDAWVVRLGLNIPVKEHRADPDRLYYVNADFQEIKRHRW